MTHPESYTAYAFTEVNGKLKRQVVPWKSPGENHIVVKVLACGVCATDDAIVDQLFPTGFPRVPGHEIIGDVVSVHPGVTYFKIGDRVGAGWHGGHCGQCNACRSGDYTCCDKENINGILTDGGYAEYATLNVDSVAHVPRDIDPAELAPLTCAGLTTFNGIRRAGGASPGDIVAVQGIGGLGHLAIQYCKAMGYQTVAISTTSSKRDLCVKLGANYFIDQTEDPDLGAAIVREAGGKAKLIVCTAPNLDNIPALFGALARHSTLLFLCLPRGTASFPIIPFSGLRCTVRGWGYGNIVDTEETIAFSRLAGVKPLIETFPLDKAQEAYDRRATARFRAVIVP